MRKNIFVLIIAIIMCGTSCSNHPSQSDKTDDPFSTENDAESFTGNYDGELTIEFYYGVRTGIYSGEVNGNGVPDGYGEFTSASSSGIVWTYEGEWTDGHWEGSGTTTWETGQSYVGEYSHDSETGKGVFTLETGEKYEGTFKSRVIRGDGILYYPDGSYFVGDFSGFDKASGTYHDAVGFSYYATINDGDLSLVPLDDFFSDPERQKVYQELYKSYRYSELIAYINDYLSANATTDLDSAYLIIELLTPALDYENQWTVFFDEFDSKYIVTFPNANSISTTNSVAVSVEGTGLDIKVGFQKNGWLFFDGIALSVDGKQIYSAKVKSYDVTRDVISGHLIEEYCYCSFYDDVLTSLGIAETAAIRFSNGTSGETYDHVLLEGEKDAMHCGLLLRNNNKELSNLLYRYNRAIPST